MVQRIRRTHLDNMAAVLTACTDWTGSGQIASATGLGGSDLVGRTEEAFTYGLLEVRPHPTRLSRIQWRRTPAGDEYLAHYAAIRHLLPLMAA